MNSHWAGLPVCAGCGKVIEGRWSWDNERRIWHDECRIQALRTNAKNKGKK